MGFNRNEIIATERGYYFDESLQLRNKDGNLVIGYINPSGYRVFGLTHNGKRITIRVHRMAAFQKYGLDIYNDGMEVRHLNNIKLDNSFENIAIGTHKDNYLDIEENDRRERVLRSAKTLSKHPAKEIINKKVDIVKKLKETGYSVREIMKIMNYKSPQAISYLLKK